MLNAVLTGDVVNSTQLPPLRRQALLARLNALFEEVANSPKPELRIHFEIHRGDGFQGLSPHPEHALRQALLVRSFLRADAGAEVFDARLAIGVGTVQLLTDRVQTSDGEAFQYSGRLLDELKKSAARTAVHTPWAEVNAELSVSLLLLEAVVSKWSSRQAEVVYQKLVGKTETEIAQLFATRQPAINQRAKAAGWHAVDRLVKRYEELILTHRHP